MSGTDAQQADSLHDEFQQGRREVFDFIKERLGFNSNRHAAKIMRDVFGVEQLMDDAFDLNDIIQTSSQTLYGEIENMLHVLAAGENVYDLTGRDKIPTYKQITGGDINAGRRSAAEDFTIMLLSIDLTHITRPFAERYMRKREEVIVPDNVKMALGYSNGRIIDDILHGVEHDVIERLPQPTLIAYEGGEPAPPRQPRQLGKVFGAVAKKAKLKGTYEGRFNRVPKSWPPFKTSPSDEPAPKVITAQTSVPRITAPAEFEPVANDNATFAAAQAAYLKTVYTEIQAEHFEAAHDTHDYAKRVGLPATWESKVVAVAEDLFFDFRTEISNRISDGAVGAGETADDAVTAAQGWLAHELAKIDIPARYPESRNQQVAAEHLVKYWLDTAHKHSPAPAATKAARPAVKKPAP